MLDPVLSIFISAAARGLLHGPMGLWQCPHPSVSPSRSVPIPQCPQPRWLVASLGEGSASGSGFDLRR